MGVADNSESPCELGAWSVRGKKSEEYASGSFGNDASCGDTMRDCTQLKACYRLKKRRKERRSSHEDKVVRLRVYNGVRRQPNATSRPRPKTNRADRRKVDEGDTKRARQAKQGEEGSTIPTRAIPLRPGVGGVTVTGRVVWNSSVNNIRSTMGSLREGRTGAHQKPAL